MPATTGRPGNISWTVRVIVSRASRRSSVDNVNVSLAMPKVATASAPLPIWYSTSRARLVRSSEPSLRNGVARMGTRPDSTVMRSPIGR